VVTTTTPLMAVLAAQVVEVAPPGQATSAVSAGQALSHLDKPFIQANRLCGFMQPAAGGARLLGSMALLALAGLDRYLAVLAERAALLTSAQVTVAFMAAAGAASIRTQTSVATGPLAQSLFGTRSHCDVDLHG